MHTTSHPKSGGGAPRIGERTPQIEGRFRRLTVHQLTLAWWLYRSGHMTRRQLRVYFATHELHERRRYTIRDNGPSARDPRPTVPSYTVEELARLVGGSGSARARADLRADVRALARIGLVTLLRHRVEFAVSADQINVDDLSGFWSMFEQMPNRRRSVPVPRRTLRALAAGFSKGTTALVIAMLIRGLFWHKAADGSGGDYRTDGRYKLSWVADHFNISRRAATDARNTLISLGWLEPLEVNQWELNRWGLRDRIVTDWVPAKVSDSADAVDETTRAVGGCDGGTVERKPFDPSRIASDESATPNPRINAESATPDLTESLSLTGDLKTRRLPTREASGVSLGSTGGEEGSRKRRDRRSRGGAARTGDATRPKPPNIRDVQAGDLGNVERLLELYRQACEIGVATPSEAGKLAFLALAERARSRGKRAGALFFWLLREKKTDFITLHDEDEARRRLKEHLFGPDTRSDEQGGYRGTTSPEPVQFSDEDRFVIACLRVANERRMEPHRVARHARDWSRDRWNEAHTGYEGRRMARSRRVDDGWDDVG